MTGNIYSTPSLPVELKLPKLTNIEQNTDEVSNAPDREAEWTPSSCPAPLHSSAHMENPEWERETMLSVIPDGLVRGRDA